MSASLAQGVLVTIISEAVLQERLIRLLSKLGVSGYTIMVAEVMVKEWETSQGTTPTLNSKRSSPQKFLTNY
ncbi:hypothetical protein NC981_25245 [Leptolyngbya sp. DQ-M1]